MNSRICRSLAATSLLAVVAILPVGLAAQRRTSDDKRQQDARITILQTTDLHHHANGTDHIGLDVNPLTGTAVLSETNLPAVLANRIDAAPATPGVQELKEWMALLSYVGTGLGGSIGPEYLSTANFAQFGSFGVAVQNRNATYPLASIGQLVGTLAGLQSAP